MMNTLPATAGAIKSAIAGSYMRTARLLGVLACVLALIAMIGWHTHNDFIVQLRPDLSPMPYNSALLLLAAGVTLICLIGRHVATARLLAAFGMLGSALTMLQYFTGADFGIDELLFRHHITTNPTAPGRMALSSTFSYLVLNTGFMMFTLNQSRRNVRGVAAVCASIVIATVIATLIGYKTNLQPLFGWSATTYMALHTALGLFMASLGLLMCSLTTNGDRLDEYDHLPLAVAGFIVIATATLLLWSGLTRQRDEQRQAALDANMRLVMGGVSTMYNEHINTLRRMANRWQAANGLNEAIWLADSTSYVNELPALRGMVWLDAGGSAARTMATEDSLLSSWQPVAAMLTDTCMQAAGEGDNMFTTPQPQAANNAYFFFVQPLQIDSGFDGCIVAEFTIAPLFDTVNLLNPGVPYYVEHEGVTVYASRIAQLRNAGGITLSTPLPLTNGGWTLLLSDAGSLQDVRSLLPSLTLGIGLGLATLFSILLGLWGISRRHLLQAMEAGEARAESEKHLNAFRTTLDRTLDCVFMIDARTLTYYYANEGALRLTGHSRDEITGKHPWDVNPALTEESFRQRIAPLLSNEASSVTYDSVQQMRDGTEVPVECFLQYIAPDKETPRFVVIVRDITQRKRVEQMKSEFVSTVSHELRTPLTSITGALGLVNGGALGEVPPAVKDMIDIAYQNGRRLTHLINDLLDIERIAAGKINFDFQVQPLMPLVNQAIDGIRTYGSDNKVGVRLLHGESGVEVRIDSQRLLQILGNLLSNAIKFSPGDTSVEVSVERRLSKVRISVRDYGRGIPDEFKPRIFQKFAQADSSDTRRQSGTGLGLAISRELAERMGGFLSFDSEPRQGSCFYLELPISNYQMDQSRIEGPLLLVVEDEPDAALLLQQILHGAGYRTSVAATGQAALTAMQQQQFAAVVVDLNLPDIHGLDLIRRIKAEPANTGLPVIVVSAHAEDGRLKLNGAGADILWLSKPVDHTRLLARLDKLAAEVPRELCRVLHVEDDADLHTVVRTMAGTKTAFTLATTLQAARERLLEGKYAAVILDLELPDGSGWDLLPAIRQYQPQARLIILTGTGSATLSDSKADSVLLKSNLTPEQLLAALHDGLEPA